MEFYVDDVGRYLKENGIKPSYQRMKVFKYLMDMHNHPTVDMIYKALCPEIPTLSKTTVYNTLNLFVEKKIANVIIIEENETRYDLTSNKHGHFKCTECGELFDVELSFNTHNCDGLDCCEIEEQHIYFKGLCKKCSAKKNN